MEYSLSTRQKQRLAKRVKPLQWKMVLRTKWGMTINWDDAYQPHKHEDDEGVARENNMKTFWNKNHIKEKFGCKVPMAYNVHKCQCFL
jgi:hypothetical protein